jgi:hypothetical protein
MISAETAAFSDSFTNLNSLEIRSTVGTCIDVAGIAGSDKSGVELDAFLSNIGQRIGDRDGVPHPWWIVARRCRQFGQPDLIAGGLGLGVDLDPARSLLWRLAANPCVGP